MVHPAAFDPGFAFGAEHVEAVLVVATTDLTLCNRAARVVIPVIVDLHVIKDVAAVRGNLSSANRGAADWRTVLHQPTNPVHCVNGLLDVAVAGEPVEAYQLRTIHSRSLMPSGLLSSGGMGFTGPVR